MVVVWAVWGEGGRVSGLKFGVDVQDLRLEVPSFGVWTLGVRSWA